MTHIYAVFAKRRSLRGDALVRVHESMRRRQQGWTYWYAGYTVWTADGRFDARTALPVRQSHYAPLRSSRPAAALMVWGCTPRTDRLDVSKLTPASIARSNLPCSLPASSLSVANKGDFSERARAGFRRQDLVATAPSGFEIGRFLMEQYGASEDALVRDIAAQGSLRERLAWVKTDFSLVICGAEHLVIHTANRKAPLFYCETPDVVIVSTVRDAIDETFAQLRNSPVPVRVLPLGQTLVFSR